MLSSHQSVSLNMAVAFLATYTKCLCSHNSVQLQNAGQGETNLKVGGASTVESYSPCTIAKKNSPTSCNVIPLILLVHVDSATVPQNRNTGFCWNIDQPQRGLHCTCWFLSPDHLLGYRLCKMPEQFLQEKPESSTWLFNKMFTSYNKEHRRHYYIHFTNSVGQNPFCRT